eukprot:gnl/Chilomastix_cuspidata/1619.p1 GENE.gnl/Chilomastix_cuspidata/1619~~gnl/Chilomastix_cuspidata/1619.p1  ORF type:complete len:774 (-),score=420.92 gnl/Chilomastix_cuspidata/1619:494-2815(-)
MAQQSFTLSELQNHCKRDKESYREEFEQQKARYELFLDIFKMSPSGEHRDFLDLISFLCALSNVYTDDLKDFPKQLTGLITEYGRVMNPSFRLNATRGLILMNSKGVFSSVDLLTTLFPLLSIHDKVLRATVVSHAVSDVVRMNARSRPTKVNGRLQAFLVRQIAEGSFIAAKKALDIFCELYRRGAWPGARAANAIADAVFHRDPRLRDAAVKFMLHADDAVKLTDDDDDDADLNPAERKELLEQKIKDTQGELRNLQLKGARTPKNARAVEKVQKKLKALLTRRRFISKDVPRVPLLGQIHDPQTYCQKLMGLIRRGTGGRPFPYASKLDAFALTAAIIEVHELVVPSFYPMIQGYIRPKQAEVIRVLSAAATASHALVPPDIVLGVVKRIASEFVHEGASDDAITIGLATIREISSRAPAGLAQDADLLNDLVLYTKVKRNKGAMAAARGLLKLYRELDPRLLTRKMRGRDGEMKSHDAGETYQGIQYGTGDGDGGQFQRMLDVAPEELSEVSDLSDDESSWESVSGVSEGDLAPAAVSKHQRKRLVTLQRRLVKLRFKNRQRKGAVPEDLQREMEQIEAEVAEIKAMLAPERDDDESSSSDAADAAGAPDAAGEASSAPELQLESDGSDESSLPEEADHRVHRERVLESRILTNEELRHLADAADVRRGLTAVRRRPTAEMLLSELPRKRLTREQKIAAHLAGTLDVEHKSRRWGRKAGSLTNAEKRKQKNQVMMAHSSAIRQKQLRSRRAKDKAARRHALRLKKGYKH